MNRLSLAAKFAHGPGIELGAFHNPWPVPHGTEMTYVDQMVPAELRARFPEVAHLPIVHTDVIASAETLEGLRNDNWGFLCSSHVLEHMESPLQALEHWLRVVKPGGHILMAVPEMTQTFDKRRPETTWEHVWREYISPELMRANRHGHFLEYLAHVDGCEGDELRDRAKLGTEQGLDIHFHCWRRAGLLDMLTNFSTLCDIRYSIESFDFQAHEVLTVLKRLV